MGTWYALVVCILSSIVSVAENDSFPRPFILQLDQNDPTSIGGAVVDQFGGPVANAKIAVFVGHPDFLVPVVGPTLLDEWTADDNGKFVCKFPSPTDYQCTRLFVIAGHPQYGLTELELDLSRRVHEIELRLKEEQPIRGRIVGPDGKNVVGLKIDLLAIADGKTSISLARSTAVPEAWPKSAVTDEDGSFIFRGAPAAAHGRSVSFQVNDERFGVQRLLAKPETDGSVTLQLKPSAMVKGTVVREDSGLPMSHAWLLLVPNEIGQVGDLQPDGIPVQTDVEGRFDVRCCRKKYLTVYVYPPEGEPYLAWVTDAQAWPAGDMNFDLQINVPRGIVVKGKVLESTSRKPIAGAAIEYWVARDKNLHLRRSFVDKAYWAAEYRRILTDGDGYFQQVVLPGPGYLIAKAPNSTYISRQITHGELLWDAPGGYFVNIESLLRISPAPDEETIDVEMEMKPGITIRGHVEGPDGQPIKRAVLLSSSFTRMQSVYWSSRREQLALDGKFELSGCDPEEDRTIFLLDAEAQLGATATLSPQDHNVVPPVIRLQPCATATVQIVDKQGVPQRNQSLSGQDFIVQMDLIGMEGVVNPQYGTQAVRNIRWGMRILDSGRYRQLQTDDDGRVTFPTLIPGAPYKLIKMSPSYQELVDFRVDTGQQYQLGKLTID